MGSLIAEQDREYLLESIWQQAQLPPVLTEALATIPHRWLGQMDESSQARFVGRAELLYQLHQHLWLSHMGEPRTGSRMQKNEVKGKKAKSSKSLH
jgi:hypothetical protein